MDSVLVILNSLRGPEEVYLWAAVTVLLLLTLVGIFARKLTRARNPNPLPSLG